MHGAVMRGIGLTSVTFRKLSAREVVELARQARIDAIEWGGDLHVPHGDLAAARAVRKMCADLEISSYGSYYRVGHSEDDNLPFEQALDTALELETGVIRVWAGARPSAESDEAYRELVVEETRRIADLARERGAVDDDFLKLSSLPEPVYREAYRKIEANYVPGPYGTAALVRDKRAYAYPDRPISDNEVKEVLEEDARLCRGSLI